MQNRPGLYQRPCLVQIGERNIRAQHHDADAPASERIGNREQTQFVPFTMNARAQSVWGAGGLGLLDLDQTSQAQHEDLGRQMLDGDRALALRPEAADPPLRGQDHALHRLLRFQGGKRIM